MNFIINDTRQCPNIESGIGSILGTREYQQDFAYLYTNEQEALGILCDGMGGLEGGEQASRTAAKTLADAFLKQRPEDGIPEFFMDAARQMDQKVVKLTGEGKTFLKAGTTVVSALIRCGKLYFMSVGDSKLYLIRENKIQSLTKEHNYRLQMTEQRDAGIITPAKFEEEKNSRMAEALISYIGMNGITRADINSQPIPLRDGDIVLLCSDGLYKCMNETQIWAMIRDNDFDMKIAADRILKMSTECSHRNQDNTTVILMKYKK